MRDLYRLKDHIQVLFKMPADRKHSLDSLSRGISFINGQVGVKSEKDIEMALPVSRLNTAHILYIYTYVVGKSRHA